MCWSAEQKTAVTLSIESKQMSLFFLECVFYFFYPPFGVSAARPLPPGHPVHLLAPFRHRVSPGEGLVARVLLLQPSDAVKTFCVHGLTDSEKKSLEVLHSTGSSSLPAASE